MTFEALLQLVVGAGVLGFGADHFRLRSEIAAFRLHVAEHYLKREGLQDVKDEMKEIRGVVFRIAGKLGVPITGGE